MAIQPITGILRRRLVLDLSIAFVYQVLEPHSDTCGGTVRKLMRAECGFYFLPPSDYLWLTNVCLLTGYHLPRVRRRDNYYVKIEDERARAAGFK
ncbi:hypothetical protein DV738_g499, partial [Chaetothyriales sp. CBS 135597]